LGHNQAIIIKESEYTLKLKMMKWEISLLTSRYIKNICQEYKVKTVQKIQMPQRGIKNNYFGMKQF
jgi:hypothetical protein